MTPEDKIEIKECPDCGKKREDIRKVTKGKCHSCYMADWVRTNPRRHNLNIQRYRRNNKEKRRTWDIAERAVKLEGLCTICKKNKAQDRHHPDYSKPKEVILVCKQCHKDIHKDTSKSDVHNGVCGINCSTCDEPSGDDVKCNQCGMTSCNHIGNKKESGDDVYTCDECGRWSSSSYHKENCGKKSDDVDSPKLPGGRELGVLPSNPPEDANKKEWSLSFEKDKVILHWANKELSDTQFLDALDELDKEFIRRLKDEEFDEPLYLTKDQVELINRKIDKLAGSELVGKEGVE